MRIVHAAALLAAAAAAPAFAQGTPTPFNGGHIEAVGGIDSISGGGDSESGVAYGIAGGYDFRRGGAVFGIEAEAAESSISDSGAELSRDLYVGGRAGGVVGNNVLLYVKAGYTNARVTAGGFGANFDGVRAGAGVEWLVGHNLSIRAEYRYSNYESDLSRNQGVVGLGFRF